MLGSVSMRVAFHAPCVVLVIKKPPQTIRRILLAMDGSSSSAKAVDFLITHLLPKQNGRSLIEVMIVYVTPSGQSHMTCAVPHIDKVGRSLNSP
jgi:nucleotide-binding universal stress UspA family protein